MWVRLEYASPLLHDGEVLVYRYEVISSLALLLARFSVSEGVCRPLLSPQSMVQRPVRSSSAVSGAHGPNGNCFFAAWSELRILLLMYC